MLARVVQYKIGNFHHSLTGGNFPPIIDKIKSDYLGAFSKFGNIEITNYRRRIPESNGKSLAPYIDAIVQDVITAYENSNTVRIYAPDDGSLSISFNRSWK